MPIKGRAKGQREAKRRRSRDLWAAAAVYAWRRATGERVVSADIPHTHTRT